MLKLKWLKDTVGDIAFRQKHKILMFSTMSIHDMYLDLYFCPPTKKEERITTMSNPLPND